jgi:N-acetylglucosamine-6-phosphate deacetylase
MAMIYHARHFSTGEAVAVTVEAGRIVTCTPSDQQPSLWIAPSFFDPQINGGRGISFNSPTLTLDHVQAVVELCRTHGIGGFCPTLITSSFDALRHGFATLAQAIEQDQRLAEQIPGFHLEGPYLSHEDGPRGAHPKVHIRDPNWEEFRRWQDAAGGRIRMVTLAPERPGALAFIEKLTASGVVAAIGHTAATGEQIRDAVKAGARTSTHLGNGCHATLPRHDNYLWEQLACDELWASIIPDGHHLPATVVKCITRVKGVQKLFITCDASSLAGLPPGRYQEWGTDLEVLPNGKIVVRGTPFLAGSGHFTDTCVANIIRMAGLSLAEAIHLASTQPRRLLNLPPVTLAAGAKADFILFDWEPDGELRIHHIVNQ